MNHLGLYHLWHRSSCPSSSQASIVSGVVHLRHTASEALYNPDVSNVDLGPYSHWSLNFRRNSRFQRMQEEENDEEEKETKTSTTKKKKNKNKSKKKPQQTDPPTIPIVKFFPSGDFPEGEIQQYKDEFDYLCCFVFVVLDDKVPIQYSHPEQGLSNIPYTL
ncbi:hypothetical protein HID58_057832 [Brassica napus]|uniref:Uncharacterized protein n=1 Tax=Brassica napus TaxID=3708 RepID=A0ABQ7XFA3_BRANA|nr:hypothetical protein HID58_057832 [Brassica napus]